MSSAPGLTDEQPIQRGHGLSLGISLDFSHCMPFREDNNSNFFQPFNCCFLFNPLEWPSYYYFSTQFPFPMGALCGQIPQVNNTTAFLFISSCSAPSDQRVPREKAILKCILSSEVFLL